MTVSNRICPQCGTPLAPNEMFCSNCGTPYTDPATMGPTQRASTPYQGTSSSSPPQIEPTQYAGPSSSSPYGSNPYDHTSYGLSDQGYSPPPPPNVGYTPPPANVNLPPAMGYGGVPGMYGQASPMQPPPQPKRGPNIGLIVGVGLLVLLLVGGGIFFLTQQKSNGTSVGKTPTAATSGTTPATTAAPQALFSDNFADNSKGWNTGSGSGFSSTVGNSIMTLSEANHKILDEPIPGGGNTAATYSDFSATTTFTITKADQNDSVGLYMRGDDNLTQGYFVDIFGDNTYDIVKVFPDSSKDTFLVSPTNSSAINSVGQQNKLAVIMKGPKIVVLINDKVVNSISDSAYTNGQIALFAENGRSSNGVKASFHSVAVYPAPDQLPS